MVLESNESARLHFGIGTWHIDEIKRQTASFKWISIDNADRSQVWKSQAAMENLLKEHRVKRFGWTTEILIPIE